jgi:hypothetical protein
MPFYKKTGNFILSSINMAVRAIAGGKSKSKLVADHSFLQCDSFLAAEQVRKHRTTSPQCQGM